MKLYVLSLAVGAFVGIVYSVLNVRSPAPPLVALVGLLGILIGEQAIPAARQLIETKLQANAWFASNSAHLLQTQLYLEQAARRNAVCAGEAVMSATASSADLILHNGRFTTLDRTNPTASAVAINGGVFMQVGDDARVLKLAGAGTRIVNLKGKRGLPGLIDNHLHIIRGGLNFKMELRWDGLRSLADAIVDAAPSGRRLWPDGATRKRASVSVPLASRRWPTADVRTTVASTGTRTCDRMVERAARRRSEVVLGCARLRLLGGLTWTTCDMSRRGSAPCSPRAGWRWLPAWAW